LQMAQTQAFADGRGGRNHGSDNSRESADSIYSLVSYRIVSHTSGTEAGSRIERTAAITALGADKKTQETNQ
jgi:hypothetical protein